MNKVNSLKTAESKAESRGLNINGSKKIPNNNSTFTLPPETINPVPNRAPTIAWVLEIGIPILVAIKTVEAAPTATEAAKEGSLTNTSGIKPFPEKFFTKAAARNIDAIEPNKVVKVAQLTAIL